MAAHGSADPDNFSLWHKCRRWRERGLTCPFAMLEKEGVTSDEDARTRTSGGAALQKAVGAELGAGQGLGAAEFLGPLLALFTVLRGVQTLRTGLGLGRVQAAGISEEATVRVLRPRVPAREGPTPARPSPAKVPVGVARAPAPRSGGGGGFFVNQAAMMQKLIGRR